MNANSRTLDYLFTPEARYVAPLFQRPYVWKQEDNWEPLWESVRDATEKQLAGQTTKPHFLGAVVLNQVLNSTGTVSAREIIDGQQRLTTLQLLIKAARDVCDERGINNLKNGFEQLCRNNAPVATDPIEKFKVWPTNVDRKFFQKVLEADSRIETLKSFGCRDSWQDNGVQCNLGAPHDVDVSIYLRRHAGWDEDARDAAWVKLSKTQQKEVKAQLEEMKQISHLMPRAYCYFYAVVDQWLDDDPQSQITAQTSAHKLWASLQTQLTLVVIDLDGEDAQLIYETMNSQGVRLLPAELVKNFLFREAELNGLNIEALYRDKWQLFDEDGGWWREEIKQGRLTRIRLDVFLQHYLALSTQKDVAATDLFGTYRDWVKRSTNNPNALSAQEQIDRFREYADIYQSFEAFTQPRRLRLFFDRLKAMEVTTVFPLLLELFKRHQHSQNVLEEIAEMLESFLVRRMVCGLTTKGYNRYFLDLMAARDKTNDFSPHAIETALKSSSSDSGRWPNDTEFETAWKTSKIYKSGSNDRANMLLLAIERHMISVHTEPHQLSEKLTVEHLMPQSWQAHYSSSLNKTSNDAANVRDQLVNTIGNLTLLTQQLNSSVSNGSWNIKRSAISTNSILRLNQGLPATWDDMSITSRADELWKRALQIWPRP